MKQIFTAYSDVFFWSGEKDVLFYNTSTFHSKIYELTSHMREICSFLSDPDNLYTVPYDNSTRQQILCDLKEEGFGTIQNYDNRIISLPPILNLHEDWERIDDDRTKSSSEILDYLSTVTIHLGGYNNGNDQYCYLQTEYPFPGNTIIDYDKLISFIYKIHNSHIKDARFVISNIIQYPHIRKILALISPLRPRLYVKDDEFSNSSIYHILSGTEIKVNVIHGPSYDKTFSIDGEFTHRLLIDSEQSYLECQRMIKDTHLSNYDITPIYNGHNKSFIIKQLYPTQEELLRSRLSKRHIYIHQKMNTFRFGHLYVTPSGDIHSSLTKEPIGTIEQSLHSLILAELNTNHSWRRTRRTNGCTRCKFVDICPSPNIIEDIMGTKCICYDLNRICC